MNERITRMVLKYYIQGYRVVIVFRYYTNPDTNRLMRGTRVIFINQSCTIDLVNALSKFYRKTKDKRVRRIIEAASQGLYDEMLTPFAIPGEILIRELTSIGATDLIERVKEGEFLARDEIPANDWAYSPHGKKVLRPYGIGL